MLIGAGGPPLLEGARRLPEGAFCQPPRSEMLLEAREPSILEANMTSGYGSDSEDEEYVVEYDDMVDFAHNCPVNGWVYEGNLNGGEQFSWSGNVKWEDQGVYWTVAKLHIHVNGHTWDWGGMWVENWHGSNISINGQAPGARPHLTKIIKDYLEQNGLPPQP